MMFETSPLLYGVVGVYVLFMVGMGLLFRKFNSDAVVQIFLQLLTGGIWLWGLAIFVGSVTGF